MNISQRKPFYGALTPQVAALRRTSGGSKVAPLSVALLLLSFVMAALVGSIIGLGNLMLLLPFAALGGLVFILAMPITWTIWMLVACSMLVVGPLVYFVKIDAARWLTPALGLGLFIPLLVRMIARPSTDRQHATFPPHLWWLGLFLISVVFSTAIDNPKLGEVFNSPRYYLVGAALLLLIATGALPPPQLERIWRFVIGVGLVQLPVAAIQYLVFARRKVRSAEWDAVVGTFPGNSEGGGASAAMGVFLVTAFVFALSMWRRGHLKTHWLILLGFGGVATVAIAEVKAVVLLIPVAVGMLYFREIKHHPWQVMLAVLLGIVLMFGLLTVYTKFQYADQAASWNVTETPRTPWEAIKNQFDPEREGTYTNIPGRVASFRIWWEQNVSAGDIPHALFGYGAAATQANRIGVGELVPRYRYNLDQTSTGMLLWETGLIGHGLLVVALLSAALTARRLSLTNHVPDIHRALLHAASVSLVIQAMTLPYKAFHMYTPPSQVLLALLLGFVAYWAREVSRTLPASLGIGTVASAIDTSKHSLTAP